MRAADLLPGAVRQLRAAGVEGAERDARRLLAYALAVPAERLTLHLQDDAPQDAMDRFAAAITARAARQPVAQITGRRQFWGREFRVTRDTLDPRPETETLIAAALEAPFSRVLDLGTGTGAILLTLLAEHGGAGMGTDLSPAALAVAAENARSLGLTPDLRQADWFDGVEGVFDLITSNPPYITEAEMAELSPEVRDWEPHLALTPGGDGLAAYRAITAGLRPHLAPGGRVLLEIGAQQGAAVAELLTGAGLTQVQILTDMDGRDRVVMARG